MCRMCAAYVWIDYVWIICVNWICMCASYLWMNNVWIICMNWLCRNHMCRMCAAYVWIDIVWIICVNWLCMHHMYDLIMYVCSICVNSQCVNHMYAWLCTNHMYESTMYQSDLSYACIVWSYGCTEPVHRAHCAHISSHNANILSRGLALKSGSRAFPSTRMCAT